MKGERLETLRIEATKSSPMVDLNGNKNLLRIEGESYPEDAAKFYSPVFKWVEKYLAWVEGPVLVELRISYLNTSSLKCIMTFLDMLEDSYRKGADIAVSWCYDRDNEIAIECGKEFQEDLVLPFTLREDNDEMSG